MKIAIEAAKTATKSGDYTVAAVLATAVGEVVAVRYTELDSSTDPTAHAEILALREAAAKLNTRYLLDCYLYTTLEPCPMCTSAAIWAKLKGIVFGASRADAKELYLKKVGMLHDWRQIDISADYVASKGIPRIEIFGPFMREECRRLLNFK